MSKTSSKPISHQPIQSHGRQLKADWDTSRIQKGAKKLLRNKMRAQENQALKNGKFDLED